MTQTIKSSKLYIALKNRLLGMSFFKALEALELARTIHDGVRKDGVTPEFQHQLEIALHSTTLKGVDAILEKLVIVCLLHDVPEDYPKYIVDFAGKSLSIQSHIAKAFGKKIAADLTLLDKNMAEKDDYFARISESLFACLAKLMDRCNNFQSMRRGNFSLEKQGRYADEVEFKFLPMAKKARKSFPEYGDAFYSLELMLKSQLEHVRDYLALAKNLQQTVTAS